MKKLRRDGINYVLSDATRSLYFEIADCDVSKADRLKKTSCVVARALLDTVPQLRRVEVGATVTYIFFGSSGRNGGVKRYDTPLLLRDALNTFDQTGEWKLPKGVYRLNPPTRKIGMRTDYLSAAGRLNSETRHLRPKSTGRHTLKQINPRFIEFNLTRA